MCFTCYISSLCFYKKTYQNWCDKLFLVFYAWEDGVGLWGGNQR